MKTQPFFTSLLLICILSLNCNGSSSSDNVSTSSSSSESKLILYFDSYEAIRAHEKSLGSTEIPNTVTDDGKIWFLSEAQGGLYLISSYELPNDSTIRVGHAWYGDFAESVHLTINPDFDMTNFPTLIGSDEIITEKHHDIENIIDAEFRSAERIAKLVDIKRRDEIEIQHSASWSGNNELGYSNYEIEMTTTMFGEDGGISVRYELKR